MKNKILFLMLFSVSVSSSAEDEWKSFVYFERHDVEARIIKYDPPITMEWNRIPEHAPQDLKEILKSSVSQSYMSYDSFDEWYQDYLKYSTEAVIKWSESADEKKRKKQELITSGLYQKFHENTRFASYIYRIDYKLGEDIYTFTLFGGGTNVLTQTPSLEEVRTNYYIGAQSFKLEEGIWKRYYHKNYKRLGCMFWRDIPLLKEILDAGYCYNSIDAFGLTPFDPSEQLKLDSVRESYPDEKVFYHPDPKERAKAVAAEVPVVAEKTPREEREPAAVASEKPSRSKWVWVLGVYTLVMTVFAVRARGSGV